MMHSHLSYHWRRSPRAKSLQVHITPWNGIEVVIPRHVSRERARDFVARHRQWIRDTWQRMREQIVDADLTLPTHIKLSAMGQSWHVAYRDRAGDRARVTASGHTLTVHYDGHDERAARQALRRWLMEQARGHFSA
ncbi:MAG: YgjP-like metallopeptidase domain-containing protein, partial [Gammaproteobacteria bacterium]